MLKLKDLASMATNDKTLLFDRSKHSKALASEWHATDYYQNATGSLGQDLYKLCLDYSPIIINLHIEGDTDLVQACYATGTQVIVVVNGEDIILPRAKQLPKVTAKAPEGRLLSKLNSVYRKQVLARDLMAESNKKQYKDFCNQTILDSGYTLADVLKMYRGVDVFIPTFDYLFNTIKAETQLQLSAYNSELVEVFNTITSSYDLLFSMYDTYARALGFVQKYVRLPETTVDHWDPTVYEASYYDGGSNLYYYKDYLCVSTDDNKPSHYKQNSVKARKRQESSLITPSEIIAFASALAMYNQGLIELEDNYYECECGHPCTYMASEYYEYDPEAYRYSLDYKELKSFGLCSSDEDTSTCPDCGTLRRYRY